MCRRIDVVEDAQYFYVFSYYIEGMPVYERTCGTKRRAKERVDELKGLRRAGGVNRTFRPHAFYSTTLPAGGFWY